MRSSNVFCELDSRLTWLVKKCQDNLIIVITSIVNVSLQMEIFLQSEKAALLKPPKKKSNSDCNILPNYRLVSNMLFLSKIIERVVPFHFNKFLTGNLMKQKSVLNYGEE